MASKKLVSDRFITPKGIAKFPRLTIPDEKYQTLGVTLLLKADDPETNKFIEMVERIQEDCYQAEVNLLKAQRSKLADVTTRRKSIISQDEDKEGNPTGFIAFKFNMKGYDRNNKIIMIPKVDAKRNSLPNDTEIWGGSVLKLAIYYQSQFAETQKVAGAKFFINAVQVVELVSGRSEGFGFAEEEGYTLQNDDVQEESENEPQF